MKLLVFGKTGQVATELARRAPMARYLARDEADFMSPEACAASVTDMKPRGVIIAAAWTAVDAAEKNPDAAFRVNAETPGAIARAAAETGIPLVYISTDYVFDGSGTDPRAPSDATAPLGVYGASKLAGEIAIRDTGATHAILRTSWVFSAHGKNFVKTMMSLSDSRDSLQIVDDQIGGPTFAGDIAAACIAIAERLLLDPRTSGTYHFSGTPETDWAGFAREIFRCADRRVRVRGIPTSDYPTPAKRPLNSRLDCRSTKAVFDIDRPDWRIGLKETLTELGVPSQ